MSLIVKRGNLLEHPEWIAHQCNSTLVQRKPSGIAAAIYDKFPESRDIYRGPRPLGEIIVTGRIINMIAQRDPGRAEEYLGDSADQRHVWFQLCLRRMDAFTDMAFPWRIGCGLAKGDWDIYMDMLLEYAKDKAVTVYKL